MRGERLLGEGLEPLSCKSHAKPKFSLKPQKKILCSNLTPLTSKSELLRSPVIESALRRAKPSMEELPKRAEWRRIQREQERERRRIRDRQRRQSMTQEQRERHLARRRRNYQLRRQRAGNETFYPQPLESSTGEANNREEHQRLTTSTSDYRPLYDSVPQHAEGQERLNLESKNIDVQIGSSVHMEALLYTESNLPKRLRLNHIRHLARNLIRPIGVSTGNHQLEAELMAKGDVSVNGSRSNTVRLNRVKRLARSINTASKETLVPNLNGTEEEQNLQPEGTRSIGNDGQSV